MAKTTVNTSGLQEHKYIRVNGTKGTSGVLVIVDAEDYEWLNQWSWQMSKAGGYARRTIRRPGCGRKSYTTLYMHRLILGVADEREVDHINGNNLDNRRVNLRLATRALNMQNLHVGRGSSGFRGVEYHKGAYTARAKCGERRAYLGRYQTAEQAALVASNWRREHMPFSEEV